jgi:hypothetical protein
MLLDSEDTDAVPPPRCAQAESVARLLLTWVGCRPEFMGIEQNGPHRRSHCIRVTMRIDPNGSRGKIGLINRRSRF